MVVLPFKRYSYTGSVTVVSSHDSLLDGDPTVFAHFTDIHVCEWYSSHEASLLAFGDEVHMHGLQTLLGTGDFHHGINKLSHLRMVGMNMPDWRAYDGFCQREASRNQTIVQVGGNHDEWGLSS